MVYYVKFFTFHFQRKRKENQTSLQTSIFVMLSKFLTRYSNLCQKYVNRNWMFLENVAPFQLQLLGPCYDRSLGNEESNKEIDFGTIFDGILMAVPKSKVLFPMFSQSESLYYMARSYV